MRPFRPSPSLLPLLLLTTAARADEPRPRLDATLRLAAARVLPPAALGPDPHHIAVSVRARDGASALAAAGFLARPAGPDTAYLDVAPEELPRLAALPGVVAVERARILHPTLDRSVALTGAPALRAELGLDGAGVFVGVIDTGIDIHHADFRTPEGRTRVAALLDVGYVRGDLHPELPDYGGSALWLAPDIDAQLDADAAGTKPLVPVPTRDTNGHGTHVAGIAAGNGRATGRNLPAGRYVGMAPGASLLIANAAHGSNFTEEDILTALDFVLGRAHAAGRPVVVNLSVGGEGGPHDGTLNLERALTDRVGEVPGRVLVVSAGNDGGRDHHAGGLRLPDGPVELHLEIPPNAPATQPLAADLWFDGPPPPITIVDPAGHAHGPVAAGHRLDEGSGDDPGHVLIDAATRGADPINHRFEATFRVLGNEARPVGAGTWKLVLDGGSGAAARAGHWDAWLVDVAAGQSQPRFTEHLDEDVRADFPAYAKGAIAVGSFVSRSGWRTVDGRAIARGTVVGRASSFSGTGPSLDGRFLPDLVAPGDFILSSMSWDAPGNSPQSAFYFAGDPTFLVGDDGVHAALRGTSQAAPHVAGAIALLFQLDPTLTPQRARELLRTAAAVDRGAPGFTPRLGFGRLDVARAAALLRRRPTGAVDPGTSSVATSRDVVLPGAASRVLVSVIPRDGTGAPLGPGHTIAITASAGRFEGDVTDAGYGRYERVLLADAPRGTASAVSATVDGILLAQRPIVWFVNDRTEVGPPPGGCTIAASPRADRRAVLLLLIPLVLVNARRRRPRRASRPPQT